MSDTTTAALRQRVAEQLASTLDQQAMGDTGLDGQIRNLAGALRELDQALAFARALASGAPLFNLELRTDALDEAQHRG